MTGQERLTLNIRRAVTKDVGLASILLYVPAVVVAFPGRIAWTDGVKTYFADDYFQYTADEQVGIVIHEALHVALRHVQRGAAVRLREGANFDARCWNFACDAVVNHAIRVARWCHLPKDACYPESCLPKELLAKRPAELWTAEETYRAMRADGKSLAQLMRCSDGFRGGDLSGSPMEHDSPGMHDERMQLGTWRERLVRAQAGSAPGSILRRLSGDIPRGDLRWESVLREFMMARLMPLLETSWSRYSRRTLALGSDAHFAEPGVARRPGICRAGVVIDTSGSISDPLLRAFIAEINSMILKTGCEVVLVDCDADVQQVSLHRLPIRQYSAKGGGGTDFRPAIALLRRERLDVAVYFTDLCGTFPKEKPPFPLLWAITNDLPIPFGRKVLMPL